MLANSSTHYSIVKINGSLYHVGLHLTATAILITLQTSHIYCVNFPILRELVRKLDLEIDRDIVIYCIYVCMFICTPFNICLIGIYAGLMGATLITFLIRATLFYFIGINASKVIHNRSFHSVLRAPIRFFDTNPVGKCSLYFHVYSSTNVYV